MAMPSRIAVRRAVGDAAFVAGLLLAGVGLYRLVGPHWSMLAGGAAVATIGFALGRS